MKCPLCSYDFDPVTLDCREAGCPLAEIQGCSMICCPNCGYQMPDRRGSALASFLERIQERFAPRVEPPAPEADPARMSVRCLKSGQTAVVADLNFSDADRLDQLCTYGLAPGSTIQVEQTEPVVILRIGGTTLSVDYEVADGIEVFADECRSQPQPGPAGESAHVP